MMGRHCWSKQNKDTKKVTDNENLRSYEYVPNVIHDTGVKYDNNLFIMNYSFMVNKCFNLYILNLVFLSMIYSYFTVLH